MEDMNDRDPFRGVQSALENLGRKLDVSAHVVRLEERMLSKATREEMNAADQRVVQDVTATISASSNATKEYVRDRVNESALKTESLLKDLEKHLKDHTASILPSAVAAAVAAAMPAREKSVHPVALMGGSGISGAGILYVILYFLGVAPAPGG